MLVIGEPDGEGAHVYTNSTRKLFPTAFAAFCMVANVTLPDLGSSRRSNCARLVFMALAILTLLSFSFSFLFPEATQCVPL